MHILLMICCWVLLMSGALSVILAALMNEYRVKVDATVVGRLIGGAMSIFLACHYLF